MSPEQSKPTARVSPRPRRRARRSGSRLHRRHLDHPKRTAAGERSPRWVRWNLRPSSRSWWRSTTRPTWRWSAGPRWRGGGLGRGGLRSGLGGCDLGLGGSGRGGGLGLLLLLDQDGDLALLLVELGLLLLLDLLVLPRWPAVPGSPAPAPAPARPGAGSRARSSAFSAVCRLSTARLMLPSAIWLYSVWAPSLFSSVAAEDRVGGGGGPVRDVVVDGRLGQFDLSVATALRSVATVALVVAMFELIWDRLLRAWSYCCPRSDISF